MQWTLELFLSPAATAEFSHVSVNHDLNGANRRLQVRLFEGGTVRIPVRPSDDPYRIRRVLPGRTIHRDADDLIAPGLKGKDFTIFSLGGGARRIEDDASLVMGRSYLLVTWNRPLPQGDYPMPVEAVEYAYVGNWKAWKIDLIGDWARIQAWCRRELRKGLELPRASIRIVHPAVEAFLPTDTIRLPAGGPLVVAIDRLDRASMIHMVSLRLEPRGPVRCFTMVGSESPVFVSLGPLSRGSYTLLVSEKDHADDQALWLQVIDDKVPTPPDARLRGRMAGRDQDLEPHWFEELATDLLTMARNGKAQISEIRVPPGYPIETADGQVDRNPAQLLTWLKQTRPPVWADAGPFGQIGFRMPATVKEPHRLPSALLDRLRWMRLAGRSWPASSSVRAPWPQSADLDVDDLPVADRTEIKAFLGVAQWPAQLSAHVLLAWNELAERLRK